MFILAYFIVAVAKVISIGLTIYMYIVIAHAILSWVSPDPYNPIVRFINQVTEPLYYQIRKRIPTVFGGIDIAPVLVILAVVFLNEFLVNSLLMLSRQLYSF
jgi:YggT family protein